MATKWVQDVPSFSRPARGPLPVAVFVVLIALITGCDDNKPSAPRKLSIVISGDTAGWLMPCGCTSNQSGGLLRRATYLADLKKSGDSIYLDAGGAAGGTSPFNAGKFKPG